MASSHHGYAFTPAGGHIHHLNGMSMLSCDTGSTVIDQVHLAMPWLARVPGNASHRHPFGDLVGSFGSFLRQTAMTTANPPYDAPDGGSADRLQLLFDFLRHLEHSKAGPM